MTPQHLEVIPTKTIKPFKYPRLAHNGYLYHFHKKCIHHLRWKCNRVYSLKCPAVLRTNMDMLELTHIAVDHEHVHGHDSVAIEALKAKLNIHKQSSLLNRNTYFKPNNLDEFFEEIDLPKNIKNNPVRFCASSKEIFFTDPLDPDYKNGNTVKYEELLKNDNSIYTIFSFENYPFNKLEQKNYENQIEVNLKDDIMKNYTSYKLQDSFNEELKNLNQFCRETSPNEHNMTINNNKENNTQQNKRTLLTNTNEKKNTSTTNTYKKINNFTTNIKKEKYTLTNNKNKNKYSLRNIIIKRNYILYRNNQRERNMLIYNTLTFKRSFIANTNKRKNKNSLITNACKQIIPSKVKLRKYTSNFTNQSLPIIINITTTTSKSTIKSTPTIISTSKILSIPTIESATEIISTSKVTSTPTVNSISTIKSLPSIKITHNMIERCLNKNINNENERISNSNGNNDVDDFSFGFDGANCNGVFDDDDDEETSIKINNFKLVQRDYMYHILYNKKNWSTILKKLSNPLKGIKVFQNILLIKVLIRMMQGNNRTKRQVQILKSRIDHWKLKFDCLEHKIKTFVNGTKSDRNMRYNSILNKEAKDTTVCTNIGVHKQKNNFDLKEKVSTELNSNFTLENLKNSKLYQYCNNQNKFLSKYDLDIMTSKSEEIKTNISSTPVMVDLIKDIPANVIISRISPKPFDTKQNNVTQSDSDIKIIQSKCIESNEIFSPESCVSKALKLNSKSLKRKISNLIQNNTSIEIKPKFRKCNELPSLASNSLSIESIPDIMASRVGPKNSQITNSTQYNTPIKMTESSINKYYISYTAESIDAIIKNLPIIKNSKLIDDKNISTRFNKHTKIIPSTSISTDLNSDVPTFSSSSMKAETSLNDNLLLNKEINPALSIVAPSNVEILMLDENLEITTKDSKLINCKEWKSPRKLTVHSESDPSKSKTFILPFALKRLSKLNNHLPSQYPVLNKLLTKPNIITQLDKGNKLNTPVIPVQLKTPLPDVVYESTQIMNEINFKETIQTNHSHNHQKSPISPNQIKPVPKAIPIPHLEIINDFTNEV